MHKNVDRTINKDKSEGSNVGTSKHVHHGSFVHESDYEDRELKRKAKYLLEISTLGHSQRSIIASEAGNLEENTTTSEGRKNTKQASKKGIPTSTKEAKKIYKKENARRTHPMEDEYNNDAELKQRADTILCLSTPGFSQRTLITTEDSTGSHYEVDCAQDSKAGQSVQQQE